MAVQLPGRSIKTQLITLIFGLTAVAILVLGFFAVRAASQSGLQASNITSAALTERAKQLMVQAANDTADKNSTLFGEIDQKTTVAANYAKDLLQNPSKFTASGWKFDSQVTRLPAGQYTNSANDPGSVFIPSMPSVPAALKRQLETTSYLDYVFPHILATESNAVAIYLMIGTASRYYPNIGLAEFTPPDFDVTTQEFYYIADPQHDPDKTTKWTTVYDDPAGNGLVTTASRPIYLDNGTLAGIVGTDVTLNNIAHNLEDYSPIDSSYAFLIDNQGRAIALPDQGYHDLLGRTPKKGEFGVNLQSVKGDFGDILSRMRAGKNGFTQATAAGTQLLVAYAAVPGTSFSVGIVARQSTVLSVITDLQNDVTTSTERVLLYQVLPASILILGLVWVFGFIYIRRLTAPIKHLTAQTARVAGGDFEIEPTSSGLDNEIDQLASAFGGMVADLRSSRHKIEEQTQELLHNEQTRLKASINSLNVGFIMTGTENEVILLNGVAQQILAYDDPAAPNSVPAHQGSWTTDAIDGQLGTSIAFKANLGRVLAAGSSFEQNEVDFRGHILRIFMAPILEDKQSLGAVVLIEDITAVKALERSKDEFFSIASHELRTPLTAVRGNAALIQQLYSPKVKDKDFDEMVTDIHDASVRLIDIVNDFLDASRLEQGRIQFENTTFPISEVLDAVSYELAAVAKERGNQITIQPSTKNVPPVFADKNRVKQIVYNLVGNAMKFTDRGTITLGAVVDGQLLRTTVTDNGPGIPEEGQRMLFRKFQQGNTMLTRDATRGTGLGLYISKLLSEQMGGHISLDHSKVGEGTTFSFALPLATGGPVVPTTTTPKPATPSEPSADSSAKPATAAAAQPVKVKTKTTKAATKAKE